MPSVLVAGATGYMGRHLCAEFSGRGYRVTALVRDARRAQDLRADRIVLAEATRPETLTGVMDGVDLVVSALGITRQADGLSYRDVDYQANLNLLTEAGRARVRRFAYIHVLNAHRMDDVPLVAAKAAFVARLQAAPMAHTVIAPSGFFSDMEDFLSMARRGRVWLFGDGGLRINPIHGADLADATATAIEGGQSWLDVGGPETLTHAELAALAFAVLDRPARITRLPDGLRHAALRALPWITPARVHGPARFFLTAMGMDMVGRPHGTRRLSEYFRALAGDGGSALAPGAVPGEAAQ